MLWGNPDFFLKFTHHRLFRRFAHFNFTAGKLQFIRHVRICCATRYKDFIVLVANNTYRNLQLFHCLKPIKKAQNPAPFTSTVSFYCRRPWHCLYFLPEPHGQGSLRPTLRSPVCAASAAAAAESSSC